MIRLAYYKKNLKLSTPFQYQKSTFCTDIVTHPLRDRNASDTICMHMLHRINNLYYNLALVLEENPYENFVYLIANKPILDESFAYHEQKLLSHLRGKLIH
jgi:hypothetical protein